MLEIWWNGILNDKNSGASGGDLTVPQIKEILAVRGIVRETEGKDVFEMDRQKRYSYTMFYIVQKYSKTAEGLVKSFLWLPVMSD